MKSGNVWIHWLCLIIVGQAEYSWREEYAVYLVGTTRSGMSCYNRTKGSQIDAGFRDIAIDPCLVACDYLVFPFRNKMTENIFNTPNKLICKVDYTYLTDPSTICGLEDYIENFHPAVEVLIGHNTLQEQALISGITENELDKSLECLFGMIHARYILTTDGMGKMLTKFLNGHFGHCPRIFCDDQSVLPIGLCDLPKISTVKTYCPKCLDVYHPDIEDKIDGAYFGPTFPHLFFMNFPHLRPHTPNRFYFPKIFGFKIHPTAYCDRMEDTTSHALKDMRRQGDSNNIDYINKV
ncbi:CSNK2B [Cordylochernes scorpioides]|uniref:Casein kinase II subunit beta n=1 Tax=Cordylochernes scorpioides TaxID=51811 RepID=A0ABY6LM63_9ARAC|nr:CSNK2B [Cordylochernes scorpioides]